MDWDTKDSISRHRSEVESKVWRNVQMAFSKLDARRFQPSAWKRDDIEIRNQSTN